MFASAADGMFAPLRVLPCTTPCLGFEPGTCAALEDSSTGVTAAVAAGMYVIGVPYFTGTQLPGCDLLADSLADPAVARALRLS